jgi:hypothetical protein
MLLVILEDIETLENFFTSSEVRVLSEIELEKLLALMNRAEYHLQELGFGFFIV